MDPRRLIPSPVPQPPLNLGDASSAPEEVVVAYHERTKHHFHGFAASPTHLDWASQPDPFRRYEGAETVPLPLPALGRALPYSQLYQSAEARRRLLDIESLSQFLRYALSLTAWKSVGNTSWALRVNPSSGNLHPTEAYAILPPLPGLADSAGVYHYLPKEHALERRATVSLPHWASFATDLPEGAFLVGLTSVHWREAWKYGERAFRYCQHDAGHALAALRLAAATLGWTLSLCDGVGDVALATTLGLDRDADFGPAERETPALLALVSPRSPHSTPPPFLPSVAALVEGASWHGRAAVLSAVPTVFWPAIDQVSAAARLASGVSLWEKPPGRQTEEPLRDPLAVDHGVTAEAVILGRRSAVAMDRTTSISKETFFRMMSRLAPTSDGRSPPWDAVGWRPRIHLGLFVHRVSGMTPGLYALVRDAERTAPLRSAMRAEFLWEGVAGAPPSLPLYLLQEGDCRVLASRVSCDQAIAGDGAFSLGMIADYLESLATFGAAFYRNLFWEAGMVGQVLYLEAEAAGVRGTGIGCYFDDAVHRVFGLTSRDWQSLYHFTVGGPVEDARLTTRPAYS